MFSFFKYNKDNIIVVSYWIIVAFLCWYDINKDIIFPLLTGLNGVLFSLYTNQKGIRKIQKHMLDFEIECWRNKYLQQLKTDNKKAP